MPTACDHFRVLTDRIAALSAKFLSDQLQAESDDPGGHVPDLDRLAAFRLLAHAELEEFLEAKAKDGLIRLTTAISDPARDVASFALVFILASCVSKTISVSWPFEYAKFLVEAEDVIRAAEKLIGENNGVKGTSFFQLSLMAGFFPDKVDQTLGSSLTSYGKQRGDVAHRSVSRVKTLLAPSAEQKAVVDLTKALGIYFDVEPTAP